MAFHRARAQQGNLILRDDDLDRERCRDQYSKAMLEDLQWLGLKWEEGPDCGGPYGPYRQSERRPTHLQTLQELHKLGLLYPCTCSRKDVMEAASAPHQEGEEPIYPGTCRTRSPEEFPLPSLEHHSGPSNQRVHWRFRVPESRVLLFDDGIQGPQHFVAGQDFGDFVVWRADNIPSYHLAVVADDIAMQITEVVRGADLLTSTARQLLLYEALKQPTPSHAHTPLMLDPEGKRLAKRHDALSIRHLRKTGLKPEDVREMALG